MTEALGTELRLEPNTFEYWNAIAEAWRTEAPLRDRQAAAAWKREHFRCGGCGDPATWSGADLDGEMVPLCDYCDVEDAAPLQCGWSDEHIASRPLIPEATAKQIGLIEPDPAPIVPAAPWFSFRIDRACWLRGNEEWLLSDAGGNRSVVGWYLIARWEEDPSRSYCVETAEQLEAAYKAASALHAFTPVNEEPGFTPAEREAFLVDGFAEIGVTLEFFGDETKVPTAVLQ